MRRAACLLLVLSVLTFGSAARAAPASPFQFTVPVTASNLHSDLTLIRAHCFVFGHSEWQSIEGVLGEGESRPHAIEGTGPARGFSGEVEVPVNMTAPNTPATAAKTFRCDLEFYDKGGGKWLNARAMGERFPLDKSVLTATETGGPISP